MQIKLTRVTPAMARKWLGTNAGNRPVRKTWVYSLRDAMVRGEFRVTHQPIAINHTRLIDGQHRLLALLESGLPFVEMMVATDVDSATFDSIDIGQKRSLSDIYQAPKEITEPISMVARILNGPYATPQQSHPLFECTGRYFEALRALHSGNKQFASSPVRVAAVAQILNGEDRAYVETLFDDLCKLRLERLPSIASQFVRQTITGVNTSEEGRLNSQYDRLVRAFRVFKQEDADCRKLIIKNGMTYVDAIRQIYADAIADGGK